MIDVENQVYTLVKDHLNSKGYNNMSSVYTESMAKFPYIFFSQNINNIYERGSDSGDLENYAITEFTAEIYASGNNKKTLAKTIASEINKVMKDIGFSRKFYSFIPNYLDNNIVRLVLRFNGIVSKENIIYGGI